MGCHGNLDCYLRSRREINTKATVSNLLSLSLCLWTNVEERFGHHHVSELDLFHHIMH